MGIISHQRVRDYELKPCPKCHEQNAIVIEESDDQSERGEKYYEITCYNCHIHTKMFRSKLSAIEDWNKRPTNSLLIENEKLREEIEKLQNEKLEWHSQVQCKLRLESQLANVLAVNEKLNVDLSGWKAKKGLEWVEVKSEADLPEDKDWFGIVEYQERGLTYETIQTISRRVLQGYAYNKFVLNLRYLDESEPNPDDIKQTEIVNGGIL